MEDQYSKYLNEYLGDILKNGKELQAKADQQNDIQSQLKLTFRRRF